MKRLPVLLLAVVLAACDSAEPGLPSQLTIAAGPSQEKLSQLFEERAPVPTKVLRTVDGAESLRLVADGKAQLGFAGADVCLFALQGAAPIQQALSLRALAGLTEDYLQVVVLADSGITSLQGLAQRKVVLGPPGSANIAAEWAIDEAEVPVERVELPFLEAAAALRKGEITALFYVGALPSPALKDIGVSLRVLPVPFGGELGSGAGVYLQRTIPPDIYGPAESAVTIGIPNVVVVRSDLDEATAHQLTALLFRINPELDRRLATAPLPVPFHPGAISFYQDSKPFLWYPEKGP